MVVTESDARSETPVAPPRPRRLLLVLLTVGILVAALGAVAWISLGDHRPARSTHGPAVRPVDFTALRPVGDAVVGYDGANVANPLSATFGDLAVVWWTARDQLTVSAIDVTTGRQRWAPRALGRFHTLEREKVLAGPDSIVLADLSAGDDSPSGTTMLVLNAADGSTRWQREIDINDSVLPYNDTLVVAARDGRGAWGLDWSTGHEKWALAPTRPGLVSTVHSDAELAGPADFGDAFSPRVGADNRVLLPVADHRVHVVDVRTGQSSVTIADVDTDRVAIAGKLYVVRALGTAYKFTKGNATIKYQVLSYDLGKPGEPRTVYTTPQEEAGVLDIAPCGSGRLCVLFATGAQTPRLVMLDIAGKRQLWSTDVSGAAERIIPVGDHILVTGQTGEWGSRYYDGAGRQLLATEDRGGEPVVRVAAGGLLRFTGPSAPQFRTLTVEGIAGQTGAAVPLGTLDAFLEGCSWNERLLTCPTPQGYRVWRFAA